MAPHYVDNLPVQIIAYRQVEEVINSKPQQWLRISTACRMRGIKVHTARNWIGMGRIPTLMLDGLFFITLEDLDRYTESRKGMQQSGSRKYTSTLPD